LIQKRIAACKGVRKNFKEKGRKGSSRKRRGLVGRKGRRQIHYKFVLVAIANT